MMRCIDMNHKTSENKKMITYIRCTFVMKDIFDGGVGNTFFILNESVNQF